MFWLMTSLFLSAEPEKQKEEIFVAAPTIHDEVLQGYQPYLTSLVVASANTNTHWVKRSKRAETVYIYDKHILQISKIHRFRVHTFRLPRVSPPQSKQLSPTKQRTQTPPESSYTRSIY